MTEINKAPYTDAEFAAFIAESESDILDADDFVAAADSTDYDGGMLLTEEEWERWKARDAAQRALLFKLREEVLLLESERALTRDFIVSSNRQMLSALLSSTDALGKTVTQIHRGMILAASRPVV